MSRHFEIFLLFYTFIVFANGNKTRVYRLAGEEDDLSSMYQPFTVAIKCNGNYTCTGSIISPTKILTTASCVLSQRSKADPGPKFRENLTVYAGSSSLASGGNVYHIEKIKVPDNYEDAKLAHDIAVLTLTTAIKYSDKQKQIELPDKDIIINSLGVTSGWGVKSEHGDLDDDLQIFESNIIPVVKCKIQFFKDYTTQVDVNDFCGISSANNRGFCYGNGGSPMIQDGKIIGIVSWGLIGCAQGSPSGFTNIYKNLEFIKEELE